MSRFESKSREIADGQKAWQSLCDQYENILSQRRRTLMRKLGHSRMEPGEDLDTYFVRIEQLIDDLAVLDEPITQHRKMDVILNGLTSDYNLVEFQAMKDSELSLGDLMLVMRNLYVNGLISRPGYTNDRGSAMFSDGSMTMDKSRLKCHGRGMLTRFQNRLSCEHSRQG